MGTICRNQQWFEAIISAWRTNGHWAVRPRLLTMGLSGAVPAYEGKARPGPSVSAEITQQLSLRPDYLGGPSIQHLQSLWLGPPMKETAHPFSLFNTNCCKRQMLHVSSSPEGSKTSEVKKRSDSEPKEVMDMRMLVKMGWKFTSCSKDETALRRQFSWMGFFFLLQAGHLSNLDWRAVVICWMFCLYIL